MFTSGKRKVEMVLVILLMCGVLVTIACLAIIVYFIMTQGQD